MKTIFNRIKSVLITSSLAVAALCSQNIRAQNLVANGNFSLGNTGFASDYFYTTVNTNPGASQITVAANPKSWNINLSSTPPWADHTQNGDNISLLANGAITSGLDVWRESITVQPNTTYSFSGWASDLAIDLSSPAILQQYVNGSPMGTAFSVPGPGPNWISFSTTFNSGAATSVTISVRDLNISAASNDFALDDMALTAVPEPSTFALLGCGFIGLIARVRRSR